MENLNDLSIQELLALREVVDTEDFKDKMFWNYNIKGQDNKAITKHFLTPIEMQTELFNIIGDALINKSIDILVGTGTLIKK